MVQLLDYRNNIDLEEDELEEDCDINYNAFEMLSTAKHESPKQTLGQRHINVAHDWKTHDSIIYYRNRQFFNHLQKF